MNDALQAELAKALATLSAKLGVGIDVLWPALIKQAYINAATSALWLVGCVVVGFYLVRLGKYLRDEADEPEFGWLNLGICTIVFVIFFGALLDSVLVAFNPEYFALQKILRIVK